MWEILVQWTTDTFRDFFLGVTVFQLFLYVSVLMFLNSSIMVPPSQYICLAAGIVASSSDLSLVFLLTIAATISNLLGTSVWYMFGRLGWYQPLLARHAGTPIFAPYLRLLPQIRIRFSRRAPLALCLFRLVPVIRSIISLPAGDVRMPILAFSASSFLGIFLWCALWTTLGAYVGTLDLRIIGLVAISVGVVSVTIYLLADWRLSKGNYNVESRH
jgi:membrane protein DedA with SNARE-associated domain